MAQLEDGHFAHLCGPDRGIGDADVITILGPGTGLGVAQLVRRGGVAHVVETEGGHTDFAPLDALEGRILAQLRLRYSRVSVERVVSGMGLTNIHQALAAIEEVPVPSRDEKGLWTTRWRGRSLVAAALDRFCLSLGAVAGGIALAQGASAVVVAGGLGLKFANHLPSSGFRTRFVAKGRFEHRMDAIPVKLITHPQPGLLGAAAAFAQAHPN